MASTVSQQSLIPNIKKPSKYSFFWWQNYFSPNPATYFEEPGVYYDRSGCLQASDASTRSYRYWENGGYYIYWNPHPVLIGNFDCSGSNSNDAALVIVIIFATIALIIACALVFNYPPIMILSWTVLFFGSIVEEIKPEWGFCPGTRQYNDISAALIALYVFCICFAVYRMQKLYNFYYPGTPGVNVDFNGLLNLYKKASFYYKITIITSIAMITWGVVFTWNNHRGSYYECPISSCTQYAWIVVHFLNIVAASAMSSRMSKKYDIMATPPAYSTQNVTKESLPPYSQV
jgi:hypothetical protein